MNQEYAYIIGWVNHHSHIDTLAELKSFIFRQMTNEEIEKFGEEPLKIAWEKLSIEEKVQLEEEIESIYQK
ncbi:hypothetical protein ACOMCU_00045 [Lysinibacillus sp. UGB7]|uniref:hypothetical protein n=1 Tax=Lysinibacillus sp. UGB7 TaxID=3411039 RepID=UPI003B7A5E80